MFMLLLLDIIFGTHRKEKLLEYPCIIAILTEQMNIEACSVSGLYCSLKPQNDKHHQIHCVHMEI